MYTQPIEVEVGEHQPVIKGGGPYRHVTVNFPNGRKGYVECLMTEDGRAELRVVTYDEDVTIYAHDQKIEKPAE